VRTGMPLVLALGDMLELGPLTAPAHDEMVREADRSGAARLLLVGPESSAAAERTLPATPTSIFPDSAAAAAALPSQLAGGEQLFVKGSRGTRMERLLEAVGSGIG